MPPLRSQEIAGRARGRVLLKWLHSSALPRRSAFANLVKLRISPCPTALYCVASVLSQKFVAESVRVKAEIPKPRQGDIL